MTTEQYDIQIFYEHFVTSQDITNYDKMITQVMALREKISSNLTLHEIPKY